MQGGGDWGLDPAVRVTRRMFGRMEEGQRALLEHLGVSRFDARLRRWRDKARARFERLWAQGMRSGGRWGADEAADLYVHCLKDVLSADGVGPPPPAPKMPRER